MDIREGVSIALCTFNGERYLQDQLNSFLEQTLAPKELVVCDDDSQDGTWDILSRFARVAPFPVIIRRNAPRLGVVANFSKAIRLCKYDYVAPSDQDDIWLPGKLEISYKTLREAERKEGATVPIMAHSDLKVVDSNSQQLAPSFMSMENIHHCETDPLKILLVQNFVTGCTTLVNRALVEASLPIPPGAIMHDWWMALIAGSRGKIVFVPGPTILYRQHGANLAGASHFFSLKNIKRIFKDGHFDAGMSLLLRQAVALQKHMEKRGDKYPDYLDRYLEGVKKGGLAAVLTAIRSGVSKQGLVRNLILYKVLAQGRYTAMQDG